MEQITKEGGVFRYGDRECSSADEAYRLFRSDYHKSLGNNAYGRLNRLGTRKERVHEYGFVFKEKKESPVPMDGKVPVYIMGLIAGVYVRMMSLEDIPEMTEEQLWDWIDYAFGKETWSCRTVGVRYKTGRTSKILNKRYR